jgi:hypothetical protein
MRLTVVAAAVAVMARGLLAQTVETPVPFDSAGRVVAVTPALATRLGLTAPAWPVATPAFREARLYSVDPGGGFVLVVQRTTGALVRIPLTAAQRIALGNAINVATAANGRPSADLAADVISEPAGDAFIRHQTFLGAAVYGPLAASLTNDATAAGAVYLAATGLSFFVSYGSAQSTPFTRAQNDLGGSLGLSTGGIGWLAGYAATGNSDRGVRALALGSAIVGTIAGVTLGKSLTDAEAHAASFGMETAAAATLLGTSIAGTSARATAGAVALVSALGYPIGVKYPRRAGYQVTAGDVEATTTSALVGVLVGSSALGAVDHPTTNQITAFLAAGYLGGAIAGDWLLARPLDFSQSDATLLNIGAVAGAFVGGVFPVLARSNSLAADTGAPALGAMLGMAIVASALPGVNEPHRVGSVRLQPRTGPVLSFVPSGLVGIAAHAQGAYSLARVSF